MQELDVSQRPQPSIPFWGRLILASLMFVVAFLSARKEFLRFEWVPYFCFGLYWLLYVLRQKGETPREYLSKPRAIASVALMVAALIGFVHNLHGLHTK